MILLIDIINWAFKIYSILLIVYILMSWLPQLLQSPVGKILEKVADPYLAVFRRFIPPIGVIDLSPIVAIFSLQFIQYGLLYLIEIVLNLLAAT